MRDQLLKFVVGYLDGIDDVRPSKILVQKTLYYLTYKGIETDYSFEAYTYGPFSMGIMDDADVLHRQNELKVEKYCYKPGDEFEAPIFDAGEEEKIKSLIDHFLFKVLEGDFSFENIELMGSAIFINQNHKDLTKEVLSESLSQWKPGKYDEKKVSQAFAKLREC
jgi:uncharacterized protein YwgA